MSATQSTLWAHKSKYCAGTPREQRQGEKGGPGLGLNTTLKHLLNPMIQNGMGLKALACGSSFSTSGWDTTASLPTSFKNDHTDICIQNEGVTKENNTKHWPFFGNAGIKLSTHYALVQSASYGQQRSCGIFHKSKRFATLLLARVSCLPLLCLMGLCYLLQGWRRFMVLYINSSKKDSEHRETD